METELLQQITRKETKTQQTLHQEFQTCSTAVINENSNRYSEVIIGLYLLGVKPPWIIRMLYRF